MAAGDAELQGLREALKVSPENVPLRLHLVETLLRFGRYEEAEVEAKEALQRAPDHEGAKLALARAFQQQGKASQALVLVEDLIRRAQRPAPAYLLHARMLFAQGEVERAVKEYHKALDADPEAADTELEARLGIRRGKAGGANDDDEVVDGKLRQHAEPDEAKGSFELERPKVGFADVGGMNELKEEIKLKIVHPLTHPEIYKAYGKPIGGGILMYGPPGCGKTLLARATAGEVQARFLAIGINDVLDMWIGASERNLHAIFEQARAHKPCVLFFDEVDALGASRSDLRHSAGRNQINQFLAELDGVKGHNDGVLILAATNAPWHLDSAFRRPGRFDRVLFVPPPDAPARAGVLRILLKGKPVENPDFDYLAKKTDGFSGADLKAVVDLAIEEKLRQAMKEGVPKPLTDKDLLAAAKKVKPSTKEWFATARNYALYSNQGGVYDDILKYLNL
ncbi:MAG: AAA family ATPase [Planctomycetes bacterium]|nr:AAA family ATPase [Planctomycetota bacterium]